MFTLSKLTQGTIYTQNIPIMVTFHTTFQEFQHYITLLFYCIEFVLIKSLTHLFYTPICDIIVIKITNGL